MHSADLVKTLFDEGASLANLTEPLALDHPSLRAIRRDVERSMLSLRRASLAADSRALIAAHESLSQHLSEMRGYLRRVQSDISTGDASTALALCDSLMPLLDEAFVSARVEQIV